MKGDMIMWKYVVALLVSILAFPLSSQAGDVSKTVLGEVGPTLAHLFTVDPFDHPMMQPHLWMDVGNDRLSFLHFSKPGKTQKLLFIGDAIKGRFCAEDQPGEGKTGFVHFHQIKTPSGAKHAHGKEAGAEGYWLRHIAMGDFVWGPKKINMHPGIAFNFPLTQPPKCG